MVVCARWGMVDKERAMDTSELTDRQLLDLHCLVLEALRQRGVVRS